MSDSIKTALVIFNASAGLATKKDIESQVRKKLEELGYRVDLFYLDKSFEARLAAYQFKEIKLVVAVGGDGTVKVAARTILLNNLKAPLAIIPFGSANILATDLGIPIAVNQALKLLVSVKTSPVDVGVINKTHYFVVGLSIGYISHIIASASKSLKSRLGSLGYLLQFVFNKIKIGKIKFKIATQNKIFWVKGNSLLIFNALNYHGLQPRKKFNLRDGVFNLYVLTNKTFFSLMSAFFHALWYREPKKYIFSLDNNYFKITLNRSLRSCQVDGDFIRLPRVIEVTVLAGAINVLIP